MRFKNIFQKNNYFWFLVAWVRQKRKRRHDIHQNDTQQNDTQQNDIQQNDIQQSDT